MDLRRYIFLSFSPSVDYRMDYGLKGGEGLTTSWPRCSSHCRAPWARTRCSRDGGRGGSLCRLWGTVGQRKKIYHIILTFFYTLKSCSCYQFVWTIEDKTKLSLRYTRVNPPSWTYKLKSYQHVLYTILETCTVSTLIYFENEEIFSSLAWVSRIIEIIIQTMRNLIVASVECKI